MTIITRTGVILLALTLGACSADNHSESTGVTREGVMLMALNVQNLFDNLDDPGKDDKAYLPIAAKQSTAHKEECAQIRNKHWRKECLELDWSDDAVTHKLSVLARVIRQVNNGQGPDVIALQEVENEHILERLRNEHLTELGYKKSILIEGTDNRGIDVAFLSKLPMVGSPKLHPLQIKTHGERARDTRGVLEARFQMPDGSTLIGYSVHFPAPYHPTDMRIAAYEHLQSLRDALPEDALVFAAGDFNTTSTEDSREKLLDKMVRPDWEVAHDYCEGCQGTYYYRPDDNWSFLDMILVSGTKSEYAAWQIQPGSVLIANTLPEQVTDQGTPARYQAASRQGASDHWPLILTLGYRSN